METPARIVGTKTTYGRARGTAGELVQGEYEAKPFLITLPIHLQSTAAAMCHHEPLIRVSPTGKSKAQAIAELLLQRKRGPQACPCNGLQVVLSSDLPIGAGMASSSADLVAVARAIDAHWDLHLQDAEIARIAASIEPTDGIMYDGVVMFDYIAGTILSGPYFPPELLLVLLDPGTGVDTVGFPRRDYDAVELVASAAALDLALAGLAAGDMSAVGRAATASALLNQPRHRNLLLPGALAVAERHHALGVAVAHSGTVVAILFSGNDAVIVAQAADDARSTFGQAVRISTMSTEFRQEPGETN